MEIVKEEKKGEGGSVQYSFPCIKLAVVADLTQYQAEELLNSDDGNDKWLDDLVEAKAYLSYPLAVIVEVEIVAEIIGTVLWQIARAYKEIYEEERLAKGKYGIAWHAIDDLVFEVIRIHENGVVEVVLGS